MIKKVLVGIVVVAVITLVLAACFVEYDPDDVPQGEPLLDSSGKTVSGTGTGTASGALYAGSQDVVVTLTLVNGYIKEVKIEHNETPAIGGQVVKIAPDFIIKANSVEIDNVSGATETSEAIRKAGKKALYQATNGAYGSADGS